MLFNFPNARVGELLGLSLAEAGSSLEGYHRFLQAFKALSSLECDDATDPIEIHRMHDDLIDRMNNEETDGLDDDYISYATQMAAFFHQMCLILAEKTAIAERRLIVVKSRGGRN